MKEISTAKRQEVVHYYVLGYSYEDIVRETGVSHGSVVNIIKEVEDGRLAIPGSTFDQVNALRQLSLDLRKRSLEPLPAQLGLLLFERFRALGMDALKAGEVVGRMVEMVRKGEESQKSVEAFLGEARSRAEAR
jgi:predicted transcriptional regulator